MNKAQLKDLIKEVIKENIISKDNYPKYPDDKTLYDDDPRGHPAETLIPWLKKRIEKSLPGDQYIHDYLINLLNQLTKDVEDYHKRKNLKSKA